MSRPSSQPGLLARITAPSRHVEEVGDRRQARFLAALLLVLPVISAAGVVVQFLLDSEATLAGLWLQLGTIALAFAGYAVARTKWWRLAVWMVVVLVGVAVYQALLVRPVGAVPFAYLVVPVVLGSVLLERQGLAAVTGAMGVVAVVLVLLLGPSLGGPAVVASGVVAFVVLAFVVAAASLHRYAVEQERRRDLAAREALSRGLLEASFGGLAVVEDGRIVEVNEGFADLFGSRPGEIVGSRLDRFLPPESLDPAGRPIEVGAQRRDGSYVPVAVSARPSSNPSHGALVVAVQDLTEREHVRTRLHQADRMAAMGQLAAGVAHEINNPLTWIIGNLERLEDRLQGEERRLLDQAVDGARRVHRIAQDLNTFAREREGPVVAVDVAEVVQSAVNMVRHEIQHQVDLEERYEATPTVDCDPTRLGQVCLNLLVNAAHAVSSGQGSQVSVAVTSDDEGWVVCRVHDDGPGIPEDLRERVFEPFFSTKSEGTGLGLAISRSLVEEMGGEMILESPPDGGASFGFRLPPGGLQPAVASASSEAVNRSEATSARVLVIDDEPAIGELLAAALADHDVTVATSGAEGRRRLFAEPWDLVLCDLMMPGVTGMQIHEDIERDAPHLASRMVFLTGGAFTPRAREFLDRVDNPVLHKPFRLGAVRDLVRDLLP